MSEVLTPATVETKSEVFLRSVMRVEVGDDCWLWTGGKSRAGYGMAGTNSRGTFLVHRLFYEQMVGPIPGGTELDHLCRNPLCVRPKHLEPVTHRENVRRGTSPSARNAQKTACYRGHELVARRDGRGRDCPTCARERERRRSRNS